MTPAVSIIVPVLDESARIGALLDELARDQPAAEVVVVDGGSCDATVDLARERGARVVESPRGRARQMNAGAAAACGEVLLFLHADTSLPRGAVTSVADAVADGADFGCFPVRIDSDDLRLRVASRIISWRSRLLVSATGDQAQFFRRSFFERLGGFPDVPLFEDMMIVAAGTRSGRWVCLEPVVRTSARRWNTHGVSRTMAKMIALRALFHLGVPPATLANYYRGHPREDDSGNTLKRAEGS